MCQRIGDRPAEAVIAFNLGHAYKNIPALRDLDQAERWYRRSLELLRRARPAGARQVLEPIGAWWPTNASWTRARPTSQPTNCSRHLNAALGFYHQALDLLPPNAVDDLAVTHNQLGIIYDDAGDLDRALPHYREAIRYSRNAGNLYGAARTRFNVALALRNAGRLADALEYAQAALRNFATYGDRAADRDTEDAGVDCEHRAGDATNVGARHSQRNLPL